MPLLRFAPLANNALEEVEPLPQKANGPGVGVNAGFKELHRLATFMRQHGRPSWPEPEGSQMFQGPAFVRLVSAGRHEEVGRQPDREEGAWPTQSQRDWQRIKDLWSSVPFEDTAVQVAFVIIGGGIVAGGVYGLYVLLAMCAPEALAAFIGSQVARYFGVALSAGALGTAVTQLSDGLGLALDADGNQDKIKAAREKIKTGSASLVAAAGARGLLGARNSASQVEQTEMAAGAETSGQVLDFVGSLKEGFRFSGEMSSATGGALALKPPVSGELATTGLGWGVPGTRFWGTRLIEDLFGEIRLPDGRILQVAGGAPDGAERYRGFFRMTPDFLASVDELENTWLVTPADLRFEKYKRIVKRQFEPYNVPAPEFELGSGTKFVPQKWLFVFDQDSVQDNFRDLHRVSSEIAFHINEAISQWAVLLHAANKHGPLSQLSLFFPADITRAAVNRFKTTPSPIPDEARVEKLHTKLLQVLVADFDGWQAGHELNPPVRGWEGLSQMLKDAAEGYDRGKRWWPSNSDRAAHWVEQQLHQRVAARRFEDQERLLETLDFKVGERFLRRLADIERHWYSFPPARDAGTAELSRRLTKVLNAQLREYGVSVPVQIVATSSGKGSIGFDPRRWVIWTDMETFKSFGYEGEGNSSKYLAFMGAEVLEHWRVLRHLVKPDPTSTQLKADASAIRAYPQKVIQAAEREPALSPDERNRAQAMHESMLSLDSDWTRVALEKAANDLQAAFKRFDAKRMEVIRRYRGKGPPPLEIFEEIELNRLPEKDALVEAQLRFNEADRAYVNRPEGQVAKRSAAFAQSAYDRFVSRR